MNDIAFFFCVGYLSCLFYPLFSSTILCSPLLWEILKVYPENILLSYIPYLFFFMPSKIFSLYCVDACRNLLNHLAHVVLIYSWTEKSYFCGEKKIKKGLLPNPSNSWCGRKKSAHEPEKFQIAAAATSHLKITFRCWSISAEW